MQNVIRNLIFGISFLMIFLFAVNGIAKQKVNQYYNTIKKEGEEPVSFVQKKLKKFDLILFDDAIHSAVEPFDFYIELLKNDQTKVDFVFVELFSMGFQKDIDAYLNNEKKDSTCLYKVFQDDISGYCLKYETYYRLLSQVWDINKSRPDSLKIKIIGVDPPTFWSGIHSRDEYEIFQSSLASRDHFMYEIIRQKMQNFEKGKKGIFLTNTRHAYKNIANKNGTPYWNTGTYFYRWHPDKTYSIRFHNVILNIESEAKLDINKKLSAEGLEKYKYSWVRLDGGLWDKAFKMNGNEPVAIPLSKNVFGHTKYIGNHMVNVKKGQTMYDAYDAVIFLKPLEELYFTAKINFFITTEFKSELKRRIEIVQGKTMNEILKEDNYLSFEQLLESIFLQKEPVKNSFVGD